MDTPLHIRFATADDAKALFEWRNDEDTRRMSASTAPLVWDEHVSWLQKVLAGEIPGRSLHIVEAAEGRIGMIRTDDDGAFVEISYNVAPSSRGKGIGKTMVLQFAREHLQGKRIRARIKKGLNPASESIARALGLKPVSETPSEGTGEPPMVEWR